MIPIRFHLTALAWASSLIACAAHAADAPPIQTLPDTAPLTWQDDIASRLVAGVDKFLLREIDNSLQRRSQHWRRDFSSHANYERSIQPNRNALAHIIGLRDPRIRFVAPQLIATTTRPALVGRAPTYDILAVRWPSVDGVHAEGLLLSPTTAKPLANIIAIPDADQSPEQLAGLLDGIPTQSQFARRLAESGCRVIVPTLISRRIEPRNARSLLTSREFLYRPAFELGRHIIGYEVHKVLAAVDFFANDAASSTATIAVIGYGEGGLLALYAAALDPRIASVCVSAYFDDRRNLWQEPIDRNVFGLLDQFGDAELATLIAPRALIIEASRGPQLTLPSQGGAPARLLTPSLSNVRSEFDRAKRLLNNLDPPPRFDLVISGDGTGPFASDPALQTLLASLSPRAKLAPSDQPPQRLVDRFDHDQRQRRQIQEIDEHTQSLLARSPDIRRQFLANLDTTSLDQYSRSAESYRQLFYNDVIGRFDRNRLPHNPRSRLAYDTPAWTGYEVVIDVYDDVFAYGILLLPKHLKPNEKRPVVVCQHGLEGRPQDIITGNNPAYHDFAAKLAERGFITFSPQNLYIFGDRFRTLQRKANPLKKTLFSIITPQHQQIVDWLKTLPCVDPQRIAFYGLSYGGKTAMRVPALVPDYCLSICSADFNDWVWKNASTRSPYSYVWTNEYEIFEFDLASTFNYAEMAALIAPRPFMVERGHFDGVAPDETVAYEFAKVRHLYAARLNLPDRCEIEFFAGPHTINGKGTFDFLHKHLNWPPPPRP